MPIITEAELRDRIRRPKRGMKVAVQSGTRFSPAARDFIAQWELEIIEEPMPAIVPATAAQQRAHDPDDLSRARFHAKMDSVQGLIQLVAARARAWRLPEMAQQLDALAASARAIIIAEEAGQGVNPAGMMGLDEVALRDAIQHLHRTLGLSHFSPAPDDHEILHWLHYLRAQIREATLDARDAFVQPTARTDLIRALEHLSSAVYHLELMFKTGELRWRIRP